MASLARIVWAFCLLGCLGAACGAPSPVPTSAPSPTAAPSPTSTQRPTPTATPSPGPLTEEEAITLLREEMAARGVDLETVRIRIGGQPRGATVRYASAYRVDSSAFRAQSVLVALAVARVLVRIEPSIDGGIRVAVIPGGGGDAGLRVTIMDNFSLAPWAEGEISDQEFVEEWTIGTVPEE